MFRTKASMYGLLATIEIAMRQRGDSAGVQAGEIARQLNLPAAYAAKVLTQLARANILHSDRGPRGGFRLMRPPETVDLLEIVEAVDGPIDAAVDTVDGLTSATESLQTLDVVFGDLAGLVRNFLRTRTIADLVGRLESQRTVGSTI